MTACTPMALLVFTRIEFLALLDTAPAVSLQIVRSRLHQRRTEEAALRGAGDAPAWVGTTASVTSEPALT